MRRDKNSSYKTHRSTASADPTMEDPCLERDPLLPPSEDKKVSFLPPPINRILIITLSVALVFLSAGTVKLFKMDNSLLRSSSEINDIIPSTSTFTKVYHSSLPSTSSNGGDPLSILIAFHSQAGGTKQLASFTADGVLRYPNATVVLIDVETMLDWNASQTAALLNSADGIILGSGVYNGNVHYIMQQWLTLWPFHLDLSWTVASAICTSGGYVNTGAESALNSMIRALQTFSAIFVGGPDWRSGNGVCAIVVGSNGASGMQDVEERAELAQQLGYRVAMLASQMKAAKKAVRLLNEDPFDDENPHKLQVKWGIDT
jgi:menaquinone-dependent protoporphyrinogen IX oxidase